MTLVRRALRLVMIAVGLQYFIYRNTTLCPIKMHFSELTGRIFTKITINTHFDTLSSNLPSDFTFEKHGLFIIALFILKIGDFHILSTVHKNNFDGM